jgi:hypothetical protein
MYIGRPWVRKLIDERVVVVIDVAVIRQFNDYLCTLHWFPTSLDWRAMPPHESFRLTASNESAAIEWVRGMAIGKHSQVVTVYKWDEPGVMCSVEAVILNLGSIFAGAPGKNFMFGADSRADGWSYHFSSLMEFDGGEVLTAIR